MRLQNSLVSLVKFLPYCYNETVGFVLNYLYRLNYLYIALLKVRLPVHNGPLSCLHFFCLCTVAPDVQSMLAAVFNDERLSPPQSATLSASRSSAAKSPQIIGGNAQGRQNFFPSSSHLQQQLGLPVGPILLYQNQPSLKKALSCIAGLARIALRELLGRRGLGRAAPRC